MKILFLTAEMPFSKVGGLADVSGSLPIELKKQDVDIRVITPCYKSVRSKLGKSLMKSGDFQIKGLKKSFFCSVYEIKDSPIPIILVDLPEYFDRDGIYTDENGIGFSDNTERFAMFSWAVLQYILEINWKPNILHLNDWHTGFIPVFLNNQYFSDKIKPYQIKIISTIHNLAYQGEFEKDKLNHIITFSKKSINDLQIYEKLNPLKAIIQLSDAITIVSPSYSKEIQTDEFGAGLESILQSKSSSIHGILNGINEIDWNPEKDENIPFNFSFKDLSGKILCKNKLLEKFGLLNNSKLPLISSISRLAHQKGFDILIPVLKNLLRKIDFSFILFGSGNVEFEKLLKNLESLYPDKVSINIEYNNKMAHWVEAGSDFFLMPSKYEPCGLNQMFSMKYGTIPIVRETGGLKDTVRNLDLNSQTGSGFTFKDYLEEELEKTIIKSIQWYKSSSLDDINKVRKRIMQIDFSWKKSANEYLLLYQKLL